MAPHRNQMIKRHIIKLSFLIVAPERFFSPLDLEAFLLLRMSANFGRAEVEAQRSSRDLTFAQDFNSIKEQQT
jgi:hypothetical protein